MYIYKEILTPDEFKPTESCKYRYEFTITFKQKHHLRKDGYTYVDDVVDTLARKFIRCLNSVMKDKLARLFLVRYVEETKTHFPHIHGVIMINGALIPYQLHNIEQAMWRKCGKTMLRYTGFKDRYKSPQDEGDEEWEGGTWMDYISKDYDKWGDIMYERVCVECKKDYDIEEDEFGYFIKFNKLTYDDIEGEYFNDKDVIHYRSYEHYYVDELPFDEHYSMKKKCEYIEE